MSNKAGTWKEIPIGGLILEPGNSINYKTGGWRVFKPVHDPTKCTSCLICWIYCPDAAVILKNGKFEKFDYDHCKGCGICARECPPKIKAVTMVKEE